LGCFVRDHEIERPISVQIARSNRRGLLVRDDALRKAEIALAISQKNGHIAGEIVRRRDIDRAIAVEIARDHRERRLRTTHRLGRVAPWLCERDIDARCEFHLCPQGGNEHCNQR
jgi:hypothetical protein